MRVGHVGHVTATLPGVPRLGSEPRGRAAPGAAVAEPQVVRVVGRHDRDGDGQYSANERVTASSGAGIELTTPDGRPGLKMAKNAIIIEVMKSIKSI